MADPADFVRAWQEYLVRLGTPEAQAPFEQALKAQAELQAQLARAYVAPFESMFELLDELASSMRAQAASLEAAAASFAQNAEVLGRQAKLVEHAVAEMRKPLAAFGVPDR